MSVTLKSEAGTQVTVSAALAEVLAAQGWKAVSKTKPTAAASKTKAAAAVTKSEEKQ